MFHLKERPMLKLVEYFPPEVLCYLLHMNFISKTHFGMGQKKLLLTSHGKEEFESNSVMVGGEVW